MKNFKSKLESARKVIVRGIYVLTAVMCVYSELVYFNVMKPII